MADDPATAPGLEEEDAEGNGEAATGGTGESSPSLWFLVFTGLAGFVALLSWIAIWAARTSPEAETEAFGKWLWFKVHEPSVVAIQLGLVGILFFIAVFYGDPGNRMRSALAGSFLLVFTLLIIDLLTIPEFRNALVDIADVPLSEITGAEDSATEAPTVTETTQAQPAVEVAKVARSFVEGLFGTFKWVVTAVVGFYFAAASAEAITKKATEAKTARAGVELQRAEAELQTSQNQLATAMAAAPAPPAQPPPA